jgi:hypothetical protein
VVVLFTKVPINDTMDLLRHFDEDVLRLFRHVWTMGYPLSLVIANFYMEDFEEWSLDLAPHKPQCWFCYMDDTFVIWPHGPDKLGDFLNHLNSIYQRIQFTMEIESEHLPFLDIDIVMDLLKPLPALCNSG